ncbi:MAG TPA: flagellar basal body rod protein FlgB [Pseudorhodoplanes sp.]|jgi:flagellar basal-body rod protein FlgB|nr:flagellar basal body rod protein FlgB [Pseudorhodoplanes sp.]
MAVSDTPILSMLRTRMQWHQERQRVLAENVSNADTPGFKPRDLAELDFERLPMTNVSLAQTSPAHLSGIGGGSRFNGDRQVGYETRPTGNAVQLEDEMLKVAANQMDYQAATALYTRSLGLLKIALGKK